MVPISISEIPILEIEIPESWSLTFGGTNMKVGGTERIGFGKGSITGKISRTKMEFVVALILMCRFSTKIFVRELLSIFGGYL